MPSRTNTDYIEEIDQFYQRHYADDIATLCENYPSEQRSLYINRETLNTYDTELADDFLNAPDQLREYAEEALRIYDTPANKSLGQAHVRITNHPQVCAISELASHHAGRFVAIEDHVQECSHVGGVG
jgi:replicative DNA helicase Mcm